MFTRLIIRVFVLWALVLGNCALAFAYDETQIATIEKEVAGYRSDLERIQGVVIQRGVTDEQLVEQKRLLETIRIEGLGFADKLADPLNEISQQLAQLGPVPAEGANETPELACIKFIHISAI